MRAESRSPSPPPPPPPPLDASGFIYSPFAEAEKSAQKLRSHAEPAATAGRSKGSGPFPFLKKNSRKEPSALNKKTPSPTAKSGRSDDPFANETQRGDFRTPSSSSKKGSHSKKDEPSSRDHYDVLLSGKDYWGLDTSLADDIRAEVNNTESGLSQQQSRKAVDSDEDLVAPRRGNAAVEDLDEFERLESAVSQSTRPTPEYKLMKATDKSPSSASSSQMAQQLLAKTSAGGAAGHSRLLAQTLAKSKAEQAKRPFASQAFSSFGYKNDDEEDEDAAVNGGEDDDGPADFRATLATARIASKAAEPRPTAAAISTATASRPMPTKPASQPLGLEDDWDAEEASHKLSDERDGRGRRLLDEGDGYGDVAADRDVDDDDMSFKFDDLPLPAVHARQPPLPPSHAATAADASRAVGSGRLERPTSTLKVDSASVSSATGRQGRGRSTAPANGAQRRTGSSGPRGRSTSVSRGGKATSEEAATAATGSSKELEEKMRSLEKELEHYRTENASIKKLKRQQEQALAETVQRKEEVLKYLENERQRTLAWCAEQRAEVEKEKRAAAKQIRDTKQKTLGTTAPIKTQKAEIEALQATLEKTKAAHDAAAKKWKTTETRLYALIHEHADHVENLEKQLMALEENRIALLEFIAQAGLRLPKALRNKIVSGDAAATAAASAATTHGVLQSQSGGGGGVAAAKGPPGGRVSSAAARQQALQRTLQRIHSQQEKQAHRGYVEEVDVEVVDVLRPKRVFDDDGDGGDGDEAGGRPLLTDGDGDEAANGRRASGSSRRSLSPKKDASLEAATFGRRRSSTSSNATTASTMSTAPAAHSARGKPGPTALSMSQKTMRQVSSSWARSSRSSGRYSQTSDDIDHDDEDFDQRDDGDDDDEDDGDGGDEAMLHRDRDEDDAFLQLSQQRNYSGKKAASPLDSTRRAIDSAFADLLQTQLAGSSSTAGVADVKSDASSRKSDAAKAPPPTTTTTTTTTMSASGGGSGRSEEIRADGTRVVRYSNGTSKEVDAAGNQKVKFANGDQKYTDAQTGTVIYFYAENQTTHTTYADGVELLEFPNGQLERHDPSGRKEVVFPNGSKKIIHPDGLQESIFPDGVRLLEYSDGRREVQRPSAAGVAHA